MEILERHGRDDLALLYLGRTKEGSLVEFVESVQPPIPRQEKWVLIVSTLRGCPVNCRFCDAGGFYSGHLKAAEIFEQIDALITARFPDRYIPVPKFKVQFARMGEPALNSAILEVLRELPERYKAPGLMPCISSVLPVQRQSFFEEIATIKNALYCRGRFQLQFSLHTTDLCRRQELIPYPLMNFSQVARIGEHFFRDGDRKIALNFALAEGFPIQPEVLIQYFDPAIFLIKTTPVNPTEKAKYHNLRSKINPRNGEGSKEIIDELKKAGYEVILSLGEPEEDSIGSNCGQYLNRYAQQKEGLRA